MRRQALGQLGMTRRPARQPTLDARLLLLRAQRLAHPVGRPGDRVARVARADVRPARRDAAERLHRLHRSASASGSSASTPGSGWAAGMGGQALNQLLVVMDGIDEPPMIRKFFTNRLNTFLDAMFVVPSKVGRLKLRLAPAARRARSRSTSSAPATSRSGARPGAHAAGPDGPPHLVPHAHQGRPPGHLRPVPGQGRPRARPGHRPPARRAGADHQRLLALDDRAVLLDGADDRPRRGPPRVRAGATSSRR